MMRTESGGTTTEERASGGSNGADGPVDFVARVRALGPAFAERAPRHDSEGSFVADNYQDLREAKVFSAIIPSDLGGGGASYAEVAAVIGELARYDGSTALSYAMHTHPVAANVYKHLHGDERSSAALRKIAAGELVIAGTGANDWLRSSGSAVAVEGGYRVTAHKRFVSGSPGADLFVTSAAYQTEEASEVLHFAIPFSTKGVTLLTNWNALGMRGTGSGDVVLDDVFVPEEAIVMRRPAGGWHPMWDVIIPTALPLITAAYVGLAEAAAEVAVEVARSKKAPPAELIGEMRSRLAVAQMALDDMVARNADHSFTPSLEQTDTIFVRKALATEAVKDTVELAAEIVGGSGFYRGHPIERMVRDVRASHFHPLPVRAQRNFTGRLALGLEPI